MKELTEISLKTIDFYLKNKKEPTEQDLQIKDSSLLTKKGCLFITLYKNGEIRGGAGNVKEIEPNIVSETIKNTIEAITNDKRFTPFTTEDVKDLRIRIDYISKRELQQEGRMYTIDPVKSGVIAMSKDYNSIGIVLPNISSKLLTGEDFIPILEAKMNKKFNEKDCYLYEIKTDVYTNY
ncbi:MAG: AMMECR1 domain-containing protein [Candidatus Gracilibacteria bacterium]